MNEMRPLRADVPVRRYVINRGVVDGGVAGATGTNIYRNTLGMLVYPPGAGVLVADDITTNCSDTGLTYVEVQVSGGGDGTGPGFDVEFEFYTDCPHNGGTPISGTNHTASLPDDGIWLVALDVGDLPVPIPNSFWLALSVSTNLAGWVVGAPPEIGSSENSFDGAFGCGTSFGNCPPNPCASFYADLYGVSCVGIFEGYRADSSADLYLVLFANDLFADDILPTTSPGLCTLARYEASLAGNLGPYEMALEVWSDDSANNRPFAPVMGTALPFSGLGVQEWAVRYVEPVVEVPTPRMWLVYDAVVNQGGPLITNDFPSLGHSEDGFAQFGVPDAAVWGGPVLNFGGCAPGQNTTPCGIFMTKVFCVGPEPSGACCVSPGNGQPDACSDSVPISQCSGRFLLNETCASVPFDPPCGVSACCTASDTCENLTESSCDAVGGLLQPGLFCEDPGLSCPAGACLVATQPCDEASPGSPGCSDVACCASVCEVDAFCCDVLWDDTCVSLIEDFCHSIPPDECVEAIDIPCDGVVVIDNTLATGAPGDPEFSCHVGGPGIEVFGSVWAKFTATATTARLRTCNSEAPAVDSLLAIYTGTCNNLTEIACNDDTDGCGANGFNSQICVNTLVPGATYYVQLAGWTDTAVGDYFLELECPASPECIFPVGSACCQDSGICTNVATTPQCDALGGLFLASSQCEDDDDGDSCTVCNDSCQGDPNKCAPGICGCSVPDTDSDADGTPACLDECDNDPGKVQPGQCGCGIPDTDTDGDGTANCDDLCPLDPLKTHPGLCGCGTPDTDTDQDGVPDCGGDQCPSDPNKILPGICGCGNSDVDSDLDGIADCLDDCVVDGCPNDPNKCEPGFCGCGVPDTDTDNSGQPDCIGAPIPTTTTWGLIAMTLLLLCGAQVLVRSICRRSI